MGGSSSLWRVEVEFSVLGGVRVGPHLQKNMSAFIDPLVGIEGFPPIPYQDSSPCHSTKVVVVSTLEVRWYAPHTCAMRQVV